jgi:hypothetical protein
LLELELDRCETEEEFWDIFNTALRRVGFTDRNVSPDDFEIHVKYNGATPWTLRAPASKGNQSEWQRLAECFRPVYARAKAKWMKT